MNLVNKVNLVHNLFLRINCAPSWFYLQDYTGMHGQENIKFCYAKQGKQIHRYKNKKIKVYLFFFLKFVVPCIFNHSNKTTM